jgi:redox-sensitive bicupin YhaK (pirin superfamily)
MIDLRKSCQRGLANHGWLHSQHSFSFADFHDPARMGWGNLRVINEDKVAPGKGFGTHGHRDMEIVSVVLDGELAHRDNMGNGQAIRPGEVQRMSAGRGVMHSEYNHAAAQTTHFLQIWLLPARLGVTPGYEQKTFDPAEQRGKLRLVCAPADEAAAAGAISVNADARLYIGRFDGAAEGAPEGAELAIAPGRKAYVHLARGSLTVNGQTLHAGDALAMDGEPLVSIRAGQGAEVLVFDLAA